MRHPSTAARFDWDEHNEAKLLKRQIHASDVEDIFWSGPRFRRNKRSGTAAWMMVGRDRGGRTLKIGIIWADEQDGVLRAITGLPVPRRSRS